MSTQGFYDRLKAERARAGQPDTEDYDACVRETVDELLAGKTTSPPSWHAAWQDPVR